MPPAAGRAAHVRRALLPAAAEHARMQSHLGVKLLQGGKALDVQQLCWGRRGQRQAGGWGQGGHAAADVLIGSAVVGGAGRAQPSRALPRACPHLSAHAEGRQMRGRWRRNRDEKAVTSNRQELSKYVSRWENGGCERDTMEKELGCTEDQGAFCAPQKVPRMSYFGPRGFATAPKSKREGRFQREVSLCILSRRRGRLCRSRLKETSPNVCIPPQC